MSTYHPNGLHDPAPATAPGAAQQTGAAEPGIAERAREEIGRRTGAARDAAVDAQAQARDVVARGSEETARFVRENPAAALAGAIGIGVLIGLALGSSRR